mgnify:CR=1 FL=1|jgi:hypothetical protein
MYQNKDPVQAPDGEALETASHKTEINKGAEAYTEQEAAILV